jgi:hypothetical protein
MTTGSAIDGRTRHYGRFYGLPRSERSPDGTAADDADLPLLLIWGNCQAEALRLVLARSPSLQFSTVRMPPVFELTSADLPHLHALAGRASILLTQPVKDNYRELPLGGAQITSMMPTGATVIHWPVIRTSIFHPFQAIVRDPDGELGDPPIVPYHDLRTLASAQHNSDRWQAPVSVSSCQEIAAQSIAELRRREQAQCDVAISDVFDTPAAGDMFTINHPGNRVLVELARRIQHLLGRPADAADPGRALLGEVRAPLPQQALTGLGIPGVESPSWQVRGAEISAQEIHLAQWQWYRAHPRIIAAGYRRHRAALDILGLG